MENKNLITIIGGLVVTLLIVNGVFLFKLTGSVIEGNDEDKNKTEKEEEITEEELINERGGIVGEINESEEEIVKEELSVKEILDGDTIQLFSGEEIRLIGLNAPEIEQACSVEATDKLEEFVLGKEIILEEDVDDKDQYGRLLRYVYFDDMFVNLELVRLGFAHKYEYGSNTKYSSQFEQAENEAKQNKGCLWEVKEIDYIIDECFIITNFHFNAAGNDNYNLNDEYVTLKNICGYGINMDNWTVKDETSVHLYYFPQFIISESKSFTLYTGTGINTNSKLYWGREEGSYAAIWNNKGGDTLFLRDNQGNLVLSKSYIGY